MMQPGFQLPNSQNVLAQRAGMMAMQPRPQFGAPMNGAQPFQPMQPRPIIQPMPGQVPMQPPMQAQPMMPNPQMMQNVARQRMMGMM